MNKPTSELPHGITSASLVDAMERIAPHRCHILDMANPAPGDRIWGPAATIEYRPLRKDVEAASFGTLFYEAIGDDGGGKVLVMASNGHPDTSIGGGTKLSRIANHRLAGVVTDARLRDFEELRDQGIKARCTGETVRWGGDLIMPAAAGGPVVVAGVTVLPGDWIYADDAAVVVIPGAHVDAVIEEARRIEKDDAEWIEKIRSEDPRDVRRGGSAEA